MIIVIVSIGSLFGWNNYYGWYSSKLCLGAKKAVDEFMIGKYEELIVGPEWQAHIVKK